MSAKQQVVLSISDDARDVLGHVDRTAMRLGEQISKFTQEHAANVVLGNALPSGSVNELVNIVADSKMLIEAIGLLKRKVP